MDEGTPKREIQPLIKALATVAAVLSAIGIASGHQVNWSTTVSKCIHLKVGGAQRYRGGACRIEHPGC